MITSKRFRLIIAKIYNILRYVLLLFRYSVLFLLCYYYYIYILLVFFPLIFKINVIVH